MNYEVKEQLYEGTVRYKANWKIFAKKREKHEWWRKSIKNY